VLILYDVNIIKIYHIPKLHRLHTETTSLNFNTYLIIFVTNNYYILAWNSQYTLPSLCTGSLQKALQQIAFGNNGS